MRTTRDRVRHAVSFEIIGILLLVPLGAIGFGMHAHDIGAVAIIAATFATLWNYIYNVLFDRAMQRWKGSFHKTAGIRILHALLFEVGLLVVTLPLIAFYLGIGLWPALAMDVGFVVFYFVYALVFNWGYDLAFPVLGQA